MVFIDINYYKRRELAVSIAFILLNYFEQLNVFHLVDTCTSALSLSPLYNWPTDSLCHITYK